MTGFEKNPNTTATYHETIAYYTELNEKSSMIAVNPFGSTDSGQPLHEVILSKDGDFDPSSIKVGRFKRFFSNQCRSLTRKFQSIRIL